MIDNDLLDSINSNIADLIRQFLFDFDRGMKIAKHKGKVILRPILPKVFYALTTNQEKN